MSTAKNRLKKQPSESIQFQMDFTNILGSSETLTGTPSVSSQIVGGGTSDLTISGISLSADSKSVLLRVQNGTHRNRYRIEVQCSGTSDNLYEGDGLLLISDK